MPSRRSSAMAEANSAPGKAMFETDKSSAAGMFGPFARDEGGELVQHRSAAEHVSCGTAEHIRISCTQVVDRCRLRCGGSGRPRKEPVHDLRGPDRLGEQIDQADVLRANGFDIVIQSRQ